MGCRHSTGSHPPNKDYTAFPGHTKGNGYDRGQKITDGSDIIESKPKSTASGLKVLVVCDKKDKLIDEVGKALERGHHVKRFARFGGDSVSQAALTVPQVLLVDLRNPSTSQPPDQLLRALNALKLEHSALFVAIVKGGNNDYISTALEWGFDKVLVENNMDGWLKDVEDSVRHLDTARSSVALTESVFTALDKSRDLVLVTDASNTIQYINQPLVQTLGYTRCEMVNRPVVNYQDQTDLVPVIRQIQKGFEWVGKVRWRTKNGDSVALHCRALPFTSLSSLPTYHLYLLDNPLENHSHPRGSLPSIRKGSYDLKSIISEGSARRQSLAKLYNLPLEAPITKVLSLLCAAQENASPSVVQMLEQVMDILRNTELYTSHLKADNLRAEDPLTTNLIAALVAQGPPSAVMPRRSSNESILKKKHVSKKENSVMLPMSRDLKETMDKILSWEFDVISVEKLTSGKPLVYVGMKIFSMFNLNKVLGVEDKTLYGWLLTMERHYRPTNSYHNSTHAADVLQATACFLTKLRNKKLLEPLDEACCLIAATTHDLGHPGKSSAFLTNSGDDLAVLYNDISVLEQHHAALTFKLTLRDDRINIFKGLDRKTYTSARACIIDTILATDMFKHFEHFTKFVTVFNKASEENPESKDKTDGDSPPTEATVHPEDLMLVKRMLIKCADVSNPTRSLNLCKQWAQRIAEEYFAQTDEEKARDLPVVMPLFDRTACSIPVSQMGFMDYIVNNMFEEWDSFIEMPEMLYHLRKNYDYWKDLHHRGLTGTDDKEATSKAEAGNKLAENQKPCTDPCNKQ